MHSRYKRTAKLGFPGGLVVKNSLPSAGDMDSVPGLGRSRMLWVTKPMCHNY